MKPAFAVVVPFLAVLGLLSGSGAQETKPPSPEEMKALQEKFRGERDHLVKSGAARRFLPVLLEKAEDMGKRADEALAQGRVLQATELYRQARWQLPYQSINVPEKHVARVLGNLRLRHGQEINDVVFSPDGKVLATASRDRTVKLWDLANGHELRTYTGHSDHVRRLAFSPDGKLIASAGAERDIKLWDPASGKDIRTIKGQGNYVTSLAFSKDGKTLVVGNDDKAVRLYEVETGTLKRALDKHFNLIVQSVAFSADGALLAVGVGDGFLKVWQYPDVLLADKAEFWAKQDFNGASSFVAFSPDGRTLARVGPDGMKLYNTPIPNSPILITEPRKTIPPPTPQSRFNCLVFSKDGKTMFTGGMDGLIRLWDAETGEAKGIFKGHNGEIRALAFNHTGSQLASASADYTIRMWNFDVVLQSRQFVPHTDPVWSCRFSPDASRFVTASADKSARVVEVVSGKVLHTLKHDAGVTVAAYSPDGKSIASAGGDKLIKLWDANTGDLAKTLQGHIGTITSLDFSSDGKTIASGSVDKRIKIWDVAGKELVNIDDHGTIPTALAFSPNGKYLAAGNTDQTIRVYHAHTGKAITSWSAHGIAVTGLGFSPDGHMLASCGADYLVRVWPFTDPFDGNIDPGLGGRSILLSGHQGPLSGVAFRKDNQHLVSCGSDMLVKLWKLEGSSGKELQTFRGHRDWVTSVNFSKDGFFFLSSSVDHGVRIWEIADREIPLLSEHTGAVEAVAVSPDSKLVASGGTDRTIKIWDLEKGVEIGTLHGPTEPIHALAFADNKTLISSSGDRAIRIWDVTTGKELPKQPGHQQNLHGLINPVPYMVAARGDKKLVTWIPANDRYATITAFDWSSGKELFSFDDGGKGDPRHVVAVSFTPDGKRAATAALVAQKEKPNVKDGKVRLWDLEKSAQLPGGDWLVFDPGTGLGDLALSPDATRLVVSSENGDVKVLDVPKRTVLHTITKAHARRINACLVSPDGKRFATVGQDNIVKLFDIATGKELRQWDTRSLVQDRGAFVVNLAFTPDNRYLVTANANTSLFVLELP